MGLGGFLGFPQRDELKYKLEEGSNALREYVLKNSVSGNKPEEERIMRYQLYWNFYDGEHWRAFNDTLLSFNYVAAFINKTISFLLGDKPITFKVSAYDNKEVDEETETLLEGIIDYHWNKSKKSILLQDILQTGSVTGDAFVILEYQIEENYVRYKVLDSRQCFPKFKYGNLEDLESIRIRIPLAVNEKEYKLQVREYTKDNIVSWYQKNTMLEPDTKYESSTEKNPYGFIPIVHIQNISNSKGYYGYSDARDILKINKMYNEKAQDMNSIIDYYGAPTTVITGANAKGLVKQLGNIWSGLPPEANVFNLSLGEDLSGFTAFMKDILKTGMHELSDVPENALGRLQAISNTSAAALQVTYQPLIQQANKKSLRYGEGIVEINKMTLRIMLKVSPDSVEGVDEKMVSDYKVEPVFTYGLPYDRLQDLQQADLELRLKINSRRSIMNRMGQKDVPSLLDEIDEDSLKQGEIQNAASGMMGNNEQ
jgi:hypothetical protein